MSEDKSYFIYFLGNLTIFEWLCSWFGCWLYLCSCNNCSIWAIHYREVIQYIFSSKALYTVIAFCSTWSQPWGTQWARIISPRSNPYSSGRVTNIVLARHVPLVRSLGNNSSYCVTNIYFRGCISVLGSLFLEPIVLGA